MRRKPMQLLKLGCNVTFWTGARRAVGRPGNGGPPPVGPGALDQVACGVGQQDLASAWAGDHVAAERQPNAPEPVDLPTASRDVPDPARTSASTSDQHERRPDGRVSGTDR